MQSEADEKFCLSADTATGWQFLGWSSMPIISDKPVQGCRLIADVPEGFQFFPYRLLREEDPAS